ncbi:MAG: hypothetical protein ACKOTB_05965, partial [Planctomycetia bacterium]
DRFRKDGRFEPAPFDRSEWVSRGAAPPRSAWRVYTAAADAQAPGRLLASVLVFGRQTDREAEMVVQGFQPDVAEAEPIVAAIAGVTFARITDGARLPVATPTGWLLSTQYRMVPPKMPAGGTPPGEPGPIDLLLDSQRRMLWQRFEDLFPCMALPELLGRTPREALSDADGRRRVEALVVEGEATSRRADSSAAWGRMRGLLGLPAPAPLRSERPTEEVPPMRWHRLELGGLEAGELRALLVTAADAGFDLAAERAASAILARTDVAPEDRWEALGILEERAEGSVRKLELIAEMRKVAAEMKASDGMLDVLELRLRLQRGDQAETMGLLEHLRRDHARDARVMEAVAGVLMEAGIDLPGLAAQRTAGGAPPHAVGGAATSGQAGGGAAGGLWTPGGAAAQPPAGEKKTIWTPGE